MKKPVPKRERISEIIGICVLTVLILGLTTLIASSVTQYSIN